MVTAVRRRFVPSARACMAEWTSTPRNATPNRAGWVAAVRAAWGVGPNRFWPRTSASPMVLRVRSPQLHPRISCAPGAPFAARPDAAVESPCRSSSSDRVRSTPSGLFDSGAVSVQDAGLQGGAVARRRIRHSRVDACAAPGGKTRTCATHAGSGGARAALTTTRLRSAWCAKICQRAGRDALLSRRPHVNRRPSSRPAPSIACWWTRPFPPRCDPPPPADIQLLRRHGPGTHSPSPQRAHPDHGVRTTQAAPAGVLHLLGDSAKRKGGQRFLAAEPRAGAAAWPENLARPPGLLDRPAGWQLLPGGGAGTDGFYYACLTKNAVPARP